LSDGGAEVALAHWILKFDILLLAFYYKNVFVLVSGLIKKGIFTTAGSPRKKFTIALPGKNPIHPTSMNTRYE